MNTPTQRTCLSWIRRSPKSMKKKTLSNECTWTNISIQVSKEN